MIMQRGGYWTGPSLLGVQHGWRVEWANGPFGRPSYRGLGNSEDEACGDLERKVAAGISDTRLPLEASR